MDSKSPRLAALRPALLVAGALVVAGCATSNALDSVLEHSRVAISRDGKEIGTRERIVRRIESGLEIVTRQTMKMAVAGTRPRTLVEQRTLTQDHQGNTIAVAHLSRAGRDETITTAHISGRIARVRRETAEDSRETEIELPPGVRFDNGAGLLEKWSPEESPRLEFYALDVRAPLIERITYEFAAAAESVDSRTLLRQSYVDDKLRSVSRLHLDDKGALINSDQAMLGSAIRIDTASAGGDGSTNPVRESLIKSPYRISRSSMSGHIRYTFGVSFGAEFTPPQTGEQRVAITAGGFTLDICDGCGPGLEAGDEYLAEARRPTFWLQSDHPHLTRIAESLRDADMSDNEKMALLERRAKKRMETIDFAGHFSAADAIARRSGDCTEGAVVLAALGRAAGIPTRVASGIVYSRERYHGVSNTFMPHAWTLAFVDGEWRSFDMSLDGFDATHIALTISDGDPGSIQAAHQLAALLEWEAMSEVRKRRPD